MVKIKEAEKTAKPVWLKTTEEELKKLIGQLAEKNAPAQIGIILRDQYGIPTTRLYGKKLGQYLKEMGIELDPDKENAEKKLERLKEHFKENKTDKKAKHKLQKAQGRVRTLGKYAERRNKKE
jgi:small subunit ribosomal protein S15